MLEKDVRLAMATTTELIDLIPKRQFMFREQSAKRWTKHSMRVLGKRAFLSEDRSAQPMQLTVETTIDGFHSVEVVGGDFHIALGNALLVAESILMTLQNTGDIRLPHSDGFDIESDTVFFGKRITGLRRSVSSPKPFKTAT